MNKGSQGNVMAVFSAFFCAMMCIAIGYVVVSGVPFVTDLVANNTIVANDSPFSKSELTSGALATRDYSFGSHDYEKLMGTISEMNKEADTPYANSSFDELLNAPVQYSLNQAEIDHLNDVFNIADKTRIPIIGIIVMTFFCLVMTIQQFGRLFAGKAMFFGGIVPLAVMAVLILWCTVSFDSFFSLFHSILFSADSWTFPSNSLLITMLPEAFWIQVGAIWAILSIILSLVLVLVGRKLSKSPLAA